jgi:DNA modification methylase
MFELIWGKSDRPAMGDGKYPLKAHANIWTYRQKDVTLKDTHFNIKRACINPEGEEEHRTKENPAGSKLKGTVQPSRLKANGTIVYRTGIGYPRSIVEAGVVKEYHEEYIGHPTQIPSMLLELLIKMATDENDLVVDPFFGSGTTGAVCERTNRRYVGIEITEEWFNKSYERIMREGKEREKTLTLKDYLKT